MTRSLARCLTVWSAVTGGVVLVGLRSLTGLADSSSWRSFDVLLPSIAAAALLCCAAWVWVVTTLVIADAVRCRVPARSGPRAVPLCARRLVLAACGVALVGSAQVGPADATPGHVVVVGQGEQARPEHHDAGVGVVAGLQLPDRTTGPRRPVGAAAGHAPTGPARGTPVVVRAGDSLWSIASALLGDHAGPGEIASLVHRLYASNRAEIGDDPDLIHPGHQLRTPLGVRPAR